MKKFIKQFLMALIMMLLLATIVTYEVKAASWTTTSLTTKDLGYGVTLDCYQGTSKSSFNSTTSIDGREQVIYTANIAKDSPARVVQWSKVGQNDNTWGSYYLRDIAKDYEEKHPGEKVIVATNNWLSDTSSNNVGELDGPQVSGGLNYRVSDKQGNEDKWVFHETYGYIPRNAFLGFDASGKNAYFSNDWNNGQNYTDKLMLSFFNGYDEEMTKLNIAVDKINEAPGDGEIAIYFKNFNGGEQKFDDAVIYKMNGQSLRYDTRSGSTFVERDAFAMGTLDAIVESLNSGYGTNLVNCFHIVSKNEEFNSLDLENKTLVAQYELLGEFADVVGGTTYYAQIVRNGEKYPGSFGHWNEINCEVHPRTAFIIKEDGTFALSVIDGRQKGRTGMDYEDMANFYVENYDAYNVFNYDGGGSTCMIIANESGQFETVNKPSDGNERRVANATLIVVDKEKYDVSQTVISDTEVMLEVSNIDSSVTKIKASIGNQIQEVVDGKVTFSDLTKDSEYEVKFKYEMDGSEHIGSTYRAKTSKTVAKLYSFDLYEATQNSVTLNIEIDDPEETFYQATVELNGETKYFTQTEVSITFEGLKALTEYDCKITVYSHTGSKTKYSIEYIKQVTTEEAEYPEKMILNVDKTTLIIGENTKIKVSFEPDGVSSRVTYTSSDESVATVSIAGRVTAIAKGTVIITVTTKEGITEEIVFTVEEPVIPDTEPNPDPEPDSDPEPEPDLDPEPEPNPDTEPDSDTEPEPNPDPEPEPTIAKKRGCSKKGCKGDKILLIGVISLVSFGIAMLRKKEK